LRLRLERGFIDDLLLNSLTHMVWRHYLLRRMSMYGEVNGKEQCAAGGKKLGGFAVNQKIQSEENIMNLFLASSLAALAVCTTIDDTTTRCSSRSATIHCNAAPLQQRWPFKGESELSFSFTRCCVRPRTPSDKQQATIGSNEISSFQESSTWRKSSSISTCITQAAATMKSDRQNYHRIRKQRWGWTSRTSAVAVCLFFLCFSTNFWPKIKVSAEGRQEVEQVLDLDDDTAEGSEPAEDDATTKVQNDKAEMVNLEEDVRIKSQDENVDVERETIESPLKGSSSDSKESHAETKTEDAESSIQNEWNESFDSEDQQPSTPMVEETSETSSTEQPDFDKRTVPQPPNKEQVEEPVVDAANIESKTEPFDDPDTAPTPGDKEHVPQPPNREKIEEPVVDAATIELKTEPFDEPDTTPTPGDKEHIPQPPNKEKIEEPVVDAAAIDRDVLESNTVPIDEPDVSPTPSSSSSSSDPEPPSPLQDDEPSSLSNDVDTMDETDVPATVESESLEDVPEETENEAIDNAPSGAGGDISSDTEVLTDTNSSQPMCGIWGDYNVARRRPADMSVLYQLFRNVEEGADWLKSTNPKQPMDAHRRPKDDTADNPRVNKDDPVADVEEKQAPLQEEDPESDVEEKEAPLQEEEATESRGSANPSAKGNEFVSGLEDLDDLFEGIDAPDELDIGSDGSSFQEVLMGSATRVVIKRITVAAKFAKEKCVSGAKSMVDRLRDEDGEIKPLHRFRNEDGEFAPLRRLRNEDGDVAPFRKLRDDDGALAPFRNLRNEDGDFAPLRKLRGEDGDFRLPSKEQLLDAGKRVHVSSAKFLHKVSDFFDRLFQGNEAEFEPDFSFLSDHDTKKPGAQS